MAAKKDFRFSLAVSEESLPELTPILLRGDLERSVRTAAEIGYDAIELHIRNAAETDSAKLANLCQRYGIRVSAVATGLESSLNHLTMVDENKIIRSEALRHLKDIVDYAAPLDCPVIIGMVRGNLNGDRESRLRQFGYFTDQLRQITDYAGAVDVSIVLEAINFYINNFLRTVRETSDFVRNFGAENLFLHIDTHHMHIEDTKHADAVRYAGEAIGYVHFAEANRMYPGSGAYDFPGLMRVLKETGYEGYISLECIPSPDSLTASKKGYDYLADVAL
jgi:sugar phosphate isomerase/epimerase